MLKEWRKIMNKQNFQKRFSNKALLVIFISLLIIFGISQIIKLQKGDNSFRAELFSIDTAHVSSILLYPVSENREEIRFVKNGNAWYVEKKNIHADAPADKVNNLLAQLLEIKPQRLAAKTSEKWKKYQLTDSLATRIKVFDNGGKQLLDLMLGKFSYQQINQSQQAFAGNNIRGISYVRLADEEETYAVDGFLTMTFNQGFNNWRNNTFLKSNKSDLKKLTFQYPNDSGFVVVKNSGSWLIDDAKVDSAEIEHYLDLLAFRNHTQFANDSKPTGEAEFRLTVDGNNMSPVIIKAFKGKNTDEYILHSSLNPNAYFTSDASGLFAEVFKKKEVFLKQSEN